MTLAERRARYAARYMQIVRSTLRDSELDQAFAALDAEFADLNEVAA